MLAAGTVLRDRYQIIRLIGQGGMGAVYQAIDKTFGSKVAIKQTFFTEDHLRKAFEREARLLNHLRHAVLPVVFDYFFEGDGQFLVMQFIPGDDLGGVMEKRKEELEPKGQPKPFACEEVLEWTDELLDALEYLHQQHPPVIHRDIKPANLKLTQRGEVILLDFGLAKGAATSVSRATPSGSIFGYTPSYAPLEQIQGSGTGPRSDLYSLAATVYHLITGLMPVDALTRATASVSGQTDPLIAPNEINPLVPESVSDILLRAMAQNPDRRPASATEMRKALREARRLAESGNEIATVVDASPSRIKRDRRNVKEDKAAYTTQPDSKEDAPPTVVRPPKKAGKREKITTDSPRPPQTDQKQPRTDDRLKSAITPRRREILELLAQGHSDEEIAEKLSIQKKTVSDHISKIQQDAAVTDRKGLIEWAVTLGIKRAITEPASYKPVVTGGDSFNKEKVTQDARALLVSGKKIEAIKLVRDTTGWGLKEAKDFVESLDTRQVIIEPDRLEPAVPRINPTDQIKVIDTTPINPVVQSRPSRGRGWLFILLVIGAIGFIAIYNWTRKPEAGGVSQPEAAGNEPAIEAFTESSSTQPPTPLGPYREAWVEPNVQYYNRHYYHVVHCRFSVASPDVYGVKVVARFFTKAGSPVKSKRSDYSTPDGQAAIQATSNILYKPATYWADFRMYLPKSLIPPGEAYYAVIEIKSQDGRTLKTFQTDPFNVL